MFEKIKKITCALFGHSRICTTCLGYRYCARCGEQLGDNLGSVDFGANDAVFVGHNCETCKANYKKLTWKDKLFAPSPFTKERK